MHTQNVAMVYMYTMSDSATLKVHRKLFVCGDYLDDVIARVGVKRSESMTGTKPAMQLDDKINDMDGDINGSQQLDHVVQRVNGTEWDRRPLTYTDMTVFPVTGGLSCRRPLNLVCEALLGNLSRRFHTSGCMRAYSLPYNYRRVSQRIAEYRRVSQRIAETPM